MLNTANNAETTSTHRLTVEVAIANEIATSQRMWPITNPLTADTTIDLRS